MPQYRSPGVYIEEIDAGPKPIEGVSTSICGAVGVTATGPTEGKPILVTSFADFTRTFGGFLTPPEPATIAKWTTQDDGGRYWHFPLAVKAFFENGGEQCYVKRVISAQASAAHASLKSGLFAEVTRDTAKDATQLTLRHLIDIQVGSQLTVFWGTAGSIVVTVTAIDESSGKITFHPAVPVPLSVKNRDFVAITVPPAPADTVSFSAKVKGNSGNDLKVQVRPIVGATYNLLVDPSIAATAPVVTTIAKEGVTPVDTITVASNNGVHSGDRVVIGLSEYTIDTVTGTDQIKIKDAPHGQLVGATLTPDQRAMPGWAAITSGGFTIAVDGGAPHSITGLNFAAQADLTGVASIINAALTAASVGAAIVWNASSHTFTLTSNSIGTTSSVSFLTAPATGTDISAMLGMTAASSGAYAAPGLFDLTTTVGTPVKQLRKASTGARTVSVWGGSAIYRDAIVELSNGHEKEIFTVASIEGSILTLSDVPTKIYFEGNKIRVIEAEATIQYAPGGVAGTEEIFSNLTLSNTGANYLVTLITEQSKLVNVTALNLSVGKDLGNFPAAPVNGQWEKLTNGNDVQGTLTTDDWVGTDGGPGKRTGIQAFEDIDDISIVIAPGIWSPVVQSALITHCELLKSRFAILDPRDGLDMDGIQTFRSPIDTKYAALYYPWVVVRDPSVSQDVAIAPSGHMAGIYSRVDNDRGVFKAPANEVILGIQRLEQDINKREQDILNPQNINVLRFFPGRGNRVWGARVVTSDASWKYVPVRRLFIYVEQSIYQGTQFVVFEPNDEPLWARVRQTITNFLTTVWRNGALQGSKPDEAFFVKCDHTTMTQDDIDNGRLICEIGIAPVKPAEFVIFRIQQKTLDQTTA
jgi:phage tail sheath protein FI